MITINGQLSIFNEYLEKNEIWQANLLIKNLFNKNIDNRDVFQEFYEFCTKIAQWNIDIPTRIMFLDQASSALVFFSENATLTKEIIEMINVCQNEVNQLRAEITKVEHIQLDRSKEETINAQGEHLLKLTDYKYALGRSKNQQDFNALLERVKEAEEQLEEGFLTEDQEKLYKELTADYPNVINQKLSEFEKVKVNDYNKKAVKDFNHVLNEFKQNEDKYKTNILELKRLVGNRLFSYDAAQLLNETLIYYNHVYSFIFGKLDEDGKYKLTELAIETERIN